LSRSANLSLFMNPAETRPLIQLANSLGCEWPHLRRAAIDSDKAIDDLNNLLSQELGRNFASEDANLVIFGSLARGEWIDYVSDLDWTYLVDGQARPEHLQVSQDIKHALPKEFRKPRGNFSRRANDKEYRFGEPGPTGTFGNLTFSHSLIHQIGGQGDSNKNTTQRILLLLESAPVGMKGAHDRVVRAIIRRYLEEQPHLLSKHESRFKVPRFLLNDIVRFWRTMAVDFASKQRDRSGEGWGLRNAKLRMSRKLIFASGLLTCFSCHLDANLQSKISTPESRDINLAYLENHVWEYVQRTPLDIVALSITENKIGSDIAISLFSAYNKFLEIMSDVQKRQRLKKLRLEDSRTDSVFTEIVEISETFAESLIRMFFDSESFGPLTKEYGVF
jgi:predicted nucleotidyltransferase